MNYKPLRFDCHKLLSKYATLVVYANLIGIFTNLNVSEYIKVESYRFLYYDLVYVDIEFFLVYYPCSPTR